MFVAEVHPKQNEYGCVVLIVDVSKTHITLFYVPYLWDGVLCMCDLNKE